MESGESRKKTHENKSTFRRSFYLKLFRRNLLLNYVNNYGKILFKLGIYLLASVSSKITLWNSMKAMTKVFPLPFLSLSLFTGCFAV